MGGNERGSGAEQGLRGQGSASEARRCQNIHVPGFQFVRTRRRRRPLGLDARDLNLWGHEVGRVLRLGLGLDAFHGGGLL